MGPWLALWKKSGIRQTAHEIALIVATEDARATTLDPDWRHRQRREPFRLKIGYMRAKIEGLRRTSGAGEYTAQCFRDDLSLLQTTLVQAGLDDLAAYDHLAELVTRSRVFGFHLVALDIRQHSKVHAQAVDELLRLAGVTACDETLAEAERCALLAKEAGLWRLRKGRVESPLDVVPLFELGYSDSNKDVGCWMANWVLENAHERLAVVCRAHRVDFRFFQGRASVAGPRSRPAAKAAPHLHGVPKAGMLCALF